VSARPAFFARVVEAAVEPIRWSNSCGVTRVAYTFGGLAFRGQHGCLYCTTGSTTFRVTSRQIFSSTLVKTKTMNQSGEQKGCFMKTNTSPITNSMSRPPWRRGFVLIAFILTGFALSPQARAVCQEGCLTLQDTVLGDDALLNDTGFGENTAIGWHALYSNTYGSFNTATGDSALASNTGGGENTAIGVGALQNHTTGFLNTATGFRALYSNTISYSNTAVGADALFNNTTGAGNIALGDSAGGALTTGSNNIDIGNGGRTGESGTIRIGARGVQTKTFIAGISGVTVPGGVGVIVGTNGQLGTVVSSERFKAEIKPMDKASEAILALKPVTFRYKKELDPDGIPQFGLVAEQVEKVNPDLVARDDEGKPYSIRYEAVNAMLLNEFLKEHRKVEEQGATITELQKEIKILTAHLKEQEAALQKVSAQIQVTRPVRQIVLNNQ
jgi:hypothetical protein